MRWSRERQVMTVDGESYIHPRAAGTDPSHDLAHLVVAAHGDLPWKPEGPHERICFAEYNAVAVQRACLQARAAVMGQPDVSGSLVLEPGGIWYASERSREAFALGVRPALVAHLFPLFVTCAALEALPDHPPIVVSFDSRTTPKTDERDRQGQRLVYEILCRAKRQALNGAMV